MLPTDWPEPRLIPQNGWALSTSHSASSYGQAVLVSPQGKPYHPGDLLTLTQVAQIQGVTPQTVSIKATRGSLPTTEMLGRRGIKAQDALLPVPPAGRPKKAP